MGWICPEAAMAQHSALGCQPWHDIRWYNHFLDSAELVDESALIQITFEGGLVRACWFQRDHHLCVTAHDQVNFVLKHQDIPEP